MHAPIKEIQSKKGGKEAGVDSGFEISYGIIQNGMYTREPGQASNEGNAIRKEDGKKLILIVFLQANHLGTMGGLYVLRRESYRNECCTSPGVKA